MVSGPDAEVLGYRGQRDAFGFPSGAQVVPGGHRAGSGEESVDLADDSAFQQPQDLFLRSAAVELAADVGAGGGVLRHPDQRDPVHGVVGSSVPTAGQPEPAGLAGGGRDRGDAAEGGEGGLADQSVGVVPGSDQQLGGDGRSDPERGLQRRVEGGDQRVDPGGQRLDLAGQVAVPLGQHPERNHGVGDDRVDVEAAAAQQRAHQPLGGQAAKLGPDRFRCAD